MVTKNEKKTQEVRSSQGEHEIEGNAYGWLRRNSRAGDFLALIKQPMTARQLARLAGLGNDYAEHLLRKLRKRSLVVCLNPEVPCGRVLWLTEAGKHYRDRWRSEKGLAPLQAKIPDLDWALYGEVTSRHRSMVVRTLTRPMGGAELRRAALLQFPGMRMDANKARDAIQFLFKKGIVRRIQVKRRHFPAYELTETGKEIQKMLILATVRE